MEFLAAGHQIALSPRDTTSVVARLTYVRRDGQSNTEDRWFEMVLVNGTILLDESDVTTTDSASTRPSTGRAVPVPRIPLVALEVQTLTSGISVRL